jgi:hypothetical protein
VQAACQRLVCGLHLRKAMSCGDCEVKPAGQFRDGRAHVIAGRLIGIGAGRIFQHARRGKRRGSASPTCRCPYPER